MREDVEDVYRAFMLQRRARGGSGELQEKKAVTKEELAAVLKQEGVRPGR